MFKTAREVIEYTGIPKTTVYRCLDKLDRSETGEYTLESVNRVFNIQPKPVVDALTLFKEAAKIKYKELKAENNELKTELAMFKARLETIEKHLKLDWD